MKFYVAARWDRREEVREIYGQLGERGHTITADWTVHKPIRPYDQNQKMAAAYAQEDLDGVRNADVFVQLVDEQLSTGVYVELGVALLGVSISGRPQIFAVGESFPSMFHFYGAVRRRKSIEEVLVEVGG